MAKKNIYSSDYAKYRYAYKTYAASKSKRKTYGQSPELPMLDEFEFEIVQTQNPSISPKELAHKSVYGITIKEKQARYMFLESMDQKFYKRVVREMTSQDFAKRYAPLLSDAYDYAKENGMTGKEAKKFISEYVFGSP